MATKTTDHVEIAYDGGTETRIVVVADSHSKPHEHAYRWIEREKPSAILHAGDIGRLSVIDELEELAPTHPVRGNIDGLDPRTPDDLVIDLTESGQGRMRILLTHIAVYGPRLRKNVAVSARKHRAQLVVCGHSHVPLIASDGELSIFNPGSLGPRRFHLPITFGVIELKNNKLGLRHVDCETGCDWSPPASGR